MVKCAECGFLAARNILTRELEEAEKTFREKGTIPLTGQLEGRPQARHESLPLCFEGVYNLRDEFEEFAGKSNPQYTDVHAVINSERQCNGFVKWQQGYSPKEHREMLDRKWVLEYQEKREKDNREWQEKQESRHSRQEWLRYILLGLVTIFVTLIATGKI
jgi:hypothetical protein